MIYSMTGFAVAAAELPHGSLNVELRSVNHRYLEVQFRLPDELRVLETAMRELIAGRLSRGKVECRLNFMPRAAGSGELQLNADLLQQLLRLNRAVQVHSPDSQTLRVADVLRWPGMLGAEGAPLDGLREPALELLKRALGELSATRGREGEKLKAMLLQRVAQMGQLAAGVAPRLPVLLAAYQEKLAARLREALGTSDDERVRQELALFAQKIDVDEELSRLQTHLSEVERILAAGGAVGKRLDFLMQELNREANTLGSKSVAAELSQVSMELKVLTEQMREQIQNIE
jgi:uncharacterized protein (TIGR00255 family)